MVEKTRTPNKEREIIVSVSQSFRHRSRPPKKRGVEKKKKKKKNRNDTHDGSCHEAVDVTRLWRVPARDFQKLLAEICCTMRKTNGKGLSILFPKFVHSGAVTKKKGVSHYAHLDADGKSFLRSPYVVMYRFNWTPRASLRSRMSHLLRKRMSCTYTATIFWARQSHKHEIAGAKTKKAR